MKGYCVPVEWKTTTCILLDRQESQQRHGRFYFHYFFFLILLDSCDIRMQKFYVHQELHNSLKCYWVRCLVLVTVHFIILFQVGSDVYLCYRKSLARLRSIMYPAGNRVCWHFMVYFAKLQFQSPLFKWFCFSIFCTTLPWLMKDLSNKARHLTQSRWNRF